MSLFLGSKSPLFAYATRSSWVIYTCVWISTSRSSWWLGDWGWPSSRPNSLIFGWGLILWFVSSPFLIRSYERLDFVCLSLALDLASALLEDVAVILTPSCSHPFSDVPTLIGLRWLPSTAKTIVVRCILPRVTLLTGVGGWEKFSLNRTPFDPSAWCDKYHKAYRLFHL